MRFIFRCCQFFFALGLLSLIILGADKLFSLGMWEEGAYPSISTDGEGHQVGATFWSSFLQIGTVTLGAFLLGSAIYYWLVVRHRWAIEDAIASMDEEEREEFFDAIYRDDP